MFKTILTAEWGDFLPLYEAMGKGYDVDLDGNSYERNINFAYSDVM